MNMDPTAAYETTQNPPPFTDKMTVLKWVSPSRLFKKRDRMFFQTVIALVVLSGLILFLAKEYLLIGVVLSIAFVTYVLETIPPDDIEHRILVKGFESGHTFYRWDEFNEFWFEEKWNQKILVFDRKTGFPNRIMVLLGHMEPKVVKDKINEYLPFREVPEKHWADTFANWLHSHLPFEKS